MQFYACIRWKFVDVMKFKQEEKKAIWHAQKTIYPMILKLMDDRVVYLEEHGIYIRGLA